MGRPANLALPFLLPLRFKETSHVSKQFGNHFTDDRCEKKAAFVGSCANKQGMIVKDFSELHSNQFGMTKAYPLAGFVMENILTWQTLNGKFIAALFEV